MKEPRQKSIGITPQEKADLEKAKKLYETETGDRVDWGKFLAISSALALGALGIYKLTKSNRGNPAVDCPECGARFIIAYPGNMPSVVQVQCPECSEEVVVDFREQKRRT